MADNRGGVFGASDDPEYEAFVVVASDMVEELGYSAVDVASLARRTGRRPAEIVEYFPTTADLLVAVLKRRDVADIAAVREVFGGVPRTQPAGKLDELVRRNAAQPGLVELYTVMAAESLDPTHPAHDYMRERYDESREIFADLLGSASDDPETLAVTVLALLDGLQLQWLREQRSFDLVATWRTISARLLP